MVGEQTRLLPLKRNAPRFLHRAQVDCRDLAVATSLGLVSDLLSLTKRRETSALNCRDVHENVVAAFIRLDEPFWPLNHFTVPFAIKSLQSN